MKAFLSLLVFLCLNVCLGQNYRDSILQLRIKHAAELSDTSGHVLNSEELITFMGPDYFEVDAQFRVTATFIKDVGPKFKMPTTTERQPIYRRYGYVRFHIGADTFQLTAYQNMALKKRPEFKRYLFIPFRDATNGKTTYGGGRYLDTQIPDGSALLIDFNLAYNPYCAYSHRYSCPIPPSENMMFILIEAGEKIPLGEH